MYDFGFQKLNIFRRQKSKGIRVFGKDHFRPNVTSIKNNKSTF